MCATYDLDYSGLSMMLLYSCWLSVLGRMGRSDEFINGFGVDSNAVVTGCVKEQSDGFHPIP
eukprot:4489530-Amphidinium_carterae.1